jgi:nicotinamidase-related amidase
VAPRKDEPVVVKGYPNAFTETELLGLLAASSGRDLVIAGFMTHMCISSTARGAFSLGYRPTIVAGATATRALPGPYGQVVSAAALQAASLASITDMFGLVVPAATDLPD